MDLVAKSFTAEQLRIVKIVLALTHSPPKIFTFDESWKSSPSPPILSVSPSPSPSPLFNYETEIIINLNKILNIKLNSTSKDD